MDGNAVIIFRIIHYLLRRHNCKEDPENWRHVFRIIYYGFGDARRYEYYQKPQKIRQVLTYKDKNLNTLSREEFDALPAAELQRMIDDQVLTDLFLRIGDTTR